MAGALRTGYRAVLGRQGVGHCQLPLVGRGDASERYLTPE
ncbi:hypothetical protein DIQ79_20375 [Mycolicibacterium smegmatis]|uniref:Uncharacterized protein n=1 Tax=Mycolicibacterium smegmatis (strain ATCC 700084 / mc(2)155) TaxID=246196 RepID=A0QU55_MYCS2|nr:hypothetical protein MSMEG_2082 [Mycolicibacterium smegmatis MC2 155]TBM47735.1 hypothetical protein DIQ86_10575 [Mycolicibacterium smegmatis]TBH34059.1 hypothetical protein EYS45_19665 [Mycolicibacterium smegmatis MC2 155]TBM49353.1 hypothetical protein DIQ85_20315 [Mycolicibacterium smegmatis]TBM59369.1 hypothetical protein DIQ83_20375 [Mycolicibacterium smegmatis]